MLISNITANGEHEFEYRDVWQTNSGDRHPGGTKEQLV